MVTRDARKKTQIEARDFQSVPISPGPQIKNRETTTAARTQTIHIVKQMTMIALKIHLPGTCASNRTHSISA